MFSFKKMSSPAVTALLLAVLLPAGSFAAEPAAKPAKAVAKPATKSMAKTAAKAPAKTAVKPAKKAEAEPAAKEPAIEPQEAAKEPAKEPSAETAKPAPDHTLVKVNGTAITQLEVDRAVKVMLAQSQVKQPLPPETMKQAEAAAIEQLTAAELLYQEAAKLAIPDLDKQIAEKVALNRAKFKSETEFLDALKGIDMTPQDMQEFTRKDIVINNFIEKKFAANAAATEAESRKFYDENLDQYFKQPETVRASHILISADEKATPEERKKAKEKAEALLKRLKAGEEFAALAKAESVCPSSTQGGDLGTFGRGQMVGPFEDSVFALKPGEVSGLVETQFGYHIIKLIEKQELKTEKFEDVKDKIANFLKGQKVQQELSSFMDELKKSAKIEKM